MEKCVLLPVPKIFLQKFKAEERKASSQKKNTSAIVKVDLNKSDSVLSSDECNKSCYSEKESDFKEDTPKSNEKRKNRFMIDVRSFILLHCPICRTEIDRFRVKKNGLECLKCSVKWLYKCRLCNNRRYRCISGVISHLKRLHKDILEDVTENIFDANQDALKFMRAICKSCNSSIMASDMKSDKCCNCTTNFVFSCTKCLKQLRGFSGAINHGSMNCFGVATYNCKDCNSGFYYEDTLEKHIREKHTTEPAECSKRHSL